VVLTTGDRTSFWRKWCAFVQLKNINPYLHKNSNSFDDIIRYVSGFVGQVREGHLGQGHRVTSARFQKAVRAIRQTSEWDRGYNPLYREPDKYLKPLKLVFSGFKHEDKLPVPELAVPVMVPQYMEMLGLATDVTPKEQAVGDFGIIAFFYLLRVGGGGIPKSKSAHQRAPSNFASKTSPSKKVTKSLHEMHQRRN